MMLAVLALAPTMPKVALVAPPLNLEARCQMHAVDGAQYELQASLKAIDGEQHDWSLRGLASPYPLSNKQDFKGRHFDRRNYQFDVVRDGISHRYNLLTAFSGFIPGEPRKANAIMTVAQRQADDTSLFVASGICDVETTRQPLS